MSIPTSFGTERRPISFDQNVDTVDFVRAFLEANYPLHKLHSPSLMTLRKEKNYPSESPYGNALKQLHQIQMENFKEQLVGGGFTVLWDEVFMINWKIVLVMIGAVFEKLSIVSNFGGTVVQW